jgi:hypothetical protein
MQNSFVVGATGTRSCDLLRVKQIVSRRLRFCFHSIKAHNQFHGGGARESLRAHDSRPPGDHHRRLRRVFRAIVEGRRGTVFFEFTGPAKTIAASQPKFEMLLNRLTEPRLYQRESGDSTRIFASVLLGIFQAITFACERDNLREVNEQFR